MIQDSALTKWYNDELYDTHDACLTAGAHYMREAQYPGDPRLYEPYMQTALGYVELAAQTHGPISAPVDCAYIWEDAMAAFARIAPDVRIINLETAVTTSDAYWPDKGIHYRMHPANIPCLTVVQIDCCVLSNNHVLDWDRQEVSNLRQKDHATRLEYLADKAMRADNRRVVVSPCSGDVARPRRAHDSLWGDLRGDRGGEGETGTGR
jgi:poly-gamma-glutamate capsule biosynthesis protein CapA/YwtB (metallophosphatase superfamily)